MLETNPEWHGKVTLIMLVVPSRIGIADYEGMKKQIEELVGKINGRFGTIQLDTHYISIPIVAFSFVGRDVRHKPRCAGYPSAGWNEFGRQGICRNSSR